MQQPEPQPDPPQAPAVAPPELPTPSEHEAVPPPAAMSATPVQHGRIWTWLLDNNHPLITTLVTLATLISCFSAVIVIPEVRSTLGLDQPAPAAPAAPLAKNDPVVVGVTVVLPSAQVPQEALPTTASLYETTAQTPVLLGSSPAAGPAAVGQPPVVAQGQQRYRTIATSDGFVAVRAEPSTQSAETARLAPGSLVSCTGIVVGEWIDGANQWADCPAAAGFIFLPLLAPATAAPPAALTASATVCDSAVVVGVAELSIRAETNREATLLGTVPGGGTVDVLCGDVVAADERTWVRIRAAGVEGWMSTRFLQIGNAQPASDVCTTATVVEVAALAIKDDTNRNATTVGEVGQGGTVDVLCRDEVAADERTWVYVRSGGVEGWMSTRYLRFPN